MERSKSDIIYTIYTILRFLAFLGWKSHFTLLTLLQKYIINKIEVLSLWFYLNCISTCVLVL